MVVNNSLYPTTSFAFLRQLNFIFICPNMFYLHVIFSTIINNNYKCIKAFQRNWQLVFKIQNNQPDGVNYKKEYFTVINATTLFEYNRFLI